MSLVWLFVLLVYGLVCGFENIRALDWWLLLIFWGQDSYDVGSKVKR